MNILQIIEDHSNQHKGLSMVSIATKAGISISSLKPLLKELHEAGKIKVREGINNKLIFKA